MLFPRPEDKPEPQKQEQSVDDMVRMLRFWNASIGGKEVIREKNGEDR